jgi:hypothetical protein
VLVLDDGAHQRKALTQKILHPPIKFQICILEFAAGFNILRRQPANPKLLQYADRPLVLLYVLLVFPHTVGATGNIANIWVRDGKWKLLRFFHSGPEQTDEFELYNLNTDPGESLNLAGQQPEVVQRLKKVLADHLGESKTLLARQNREYDPHFRQAGIEILQGGFLAGPADEKAATITAKNLKVTLRYHPPADATGDKMRLTISSNCVRHVTAAQGDALVFGPPVRVTPDALNQDLTIPLGPSSSGGPVTILLELEQPGSAVITSPRLIE